jgi:hypothetical protein
MTDPYGNWPKWLEDFGNAVADFFSNIGEALFTSIELDQINK